MSRFELPPPFCKGCQNGDSFYKWTCNKNLIFRIQRFRNYELWRDYLSSTSWVYCIYLALFVVIIMTILFMTIGLIVNRKNKSLWIHSEVILYLLFWRKKTLHSLRTVTDHYIKSYKGVPEVISTLLCLNHRHHH